MVSRGARGVAKAELSCEADSENYLGGSSETMYYIGLDVHKRTISYCVKDAAGCVHLEGKIGSTRRELDAWIKTLPQPRTIAMEATIFTGWIYDHLLPHAEKLKVAHPLMLRPSRQPSGRTTRSMPARSPTACAATCCRSATWPRPRSAIGDARCAIGTWCSGRQC